MNLKDHEKFVAFMALLVSLMVIVIVLRFWPVENNSVSTQILNLIVGGLLGGFGAAVNALLKASADTVKVDNKPSEPIPTAPQATTAEEVPDYAR